MFINTVTSYFIFCAVEGPDLTIVTCAKHCFIIRVHKQHLITRRTEFIQFV